MTNGTNVFHTRQDFLSNNDRKTQFIRLLSEELQKEGHTVINCDGELDTCVIDAALDIICDNNIVTMVAEDRYFDPIDLLLEFGDARCLLKNRSK